MFPDNFEEMSLIFGEESKERVNFCSISFNDFLVGHHLSFARQTVDIAPTQSQVCGYLFLAGLKL